MLEVVAQRGRSEKADAGLEDALLLLRRLRASDKPEHHAQADVIESKLYPEAPRALRYLEKWHDELHGRSGATMDGLAPLSFSTIAHWAQLTHREPLPHEVDALILLDTARRHPPPADKDTPDVVDNRNAWPSR